MRLKEKKFFDEKWGMAGVMLICWLPYFILRFPGNMDNIDTYWQILEYYGYAAKLDHHPWFDTLLFGGFWRLGDFVGSHIFAVAFYCVLQMIITAIVFAVVIEYIGEKNLALWLRRVLLCFCAFFPFIPLSVTTMSKDALFGWIWLLYLMMYMETLFSKGEYLKGKKAVLFGGISLLVLLTKKTGLILIVLCMIAAVIYLHKNRVKELLLSQILVLLIFIVGWNHMILPMMGVGKGEEREIYSLPCQQVALYIQEYGDTITQEQWEMLEIVFDNPYSMGEDYVPARADSSKAHWKTTTTMGEKAAFLKVYFQWFSTHPGCFVRAVVYNTSPIFVPGANAEDSESFLNYIDGIPRIDYAEGFHNSLLWCMTDGNGIDQIAELFDDMLRTPAAGERIWKANAFYCKIAGAVKIPFSRALVAFWIPLVGLILAIKRKAWDVLIGMIPVVLMTLSIFAGPVAIPRYFIGCVYVIPLIVGLSIVTSEKVQKSQ